ncbi:MAG: trypsin-like peptidase domain-containing protein [Planctomycetaceae bacterium]|nr:trypsin-like peptidase domain-containing protein [Planctomycetaceae bacterium]
MRIPILAFPVLLALGAVARGQEIKNEDPVSTIETAYQSASEKAAPSVVAIRVDREPEAAPKPQPGPGLRGRFGQPREDPFARRPASAWCTGLVIEASGTILTTNFNVSGKVKSIKVQLPDGRSLDGKLMGYNGTYDLAAIKVEAEGLPVLKKARLEELKTGQPLLALGRAPDGKGLTVNPGIVSAASRLSGKGIQIDSKLNYGNVGGPVVDLEGRLVAISCKVDVKYAAMFGQNSGVGFAITHDRLNGVLADLKAGKNEAEPRRPFLGVGPSENDKPQDGAEVGTVQPGSAAERAGLKPHDLITEFEGHKVGQFDELRAMIMRKSAGDKVKLKVVRGEDELEIECVLGSALNELP